MSRLPTVKPREIIKVLLKLGFVERKGRGSHRVYRHPTTNRMVVVPVHPGDLKPNLVKEIIKQAGLTEEEFRELL
ncbi:MAG: type II toxin-antitoxin system HicA family toxin [Candidatus Hydrogenedentes bacterium]|nr:type II toxin-antitoxin system HicA family toxin [Candidatus Hydrogenedentota bacterium]